MAADNSGGSGRVWPAFGKNPPTKKSPAGSLTACTNGVMNGRPRQEISLFVIVNLNRLMNCPGELLLADNR